MRYLFHVRQLKLNCTPAFLFHKPLIYPLYLPLRITSPVHHSDRHVLLGERRVIAGAFAQRLQRPWLALMDLSYTFKDHFGGEIHLVVDFPGLQVSGDFLKECLVRVVVLGQSWVLIMGPV